MTESFREAGQDQDEQIAQQLKRWQVASQSQATDFDDIWRQAEVKVQTNTQKLSLSQLLSAHSRLVWAVPAAALVLMCTVILVQFETETETFEFNQPMVSAFVTSDDQLFKALIQSTHWVAPSDRFLKKTPQLNIWGLPVLDIQSPGSS